MLKTISTATALLSLSSLSALAGQNVANVSASLLFDGGSPESERLAEDFQQALHLLEGQVIWLNLDLLNAAPDAGNTYDVTQRPGGQHTGADQPEAYVCGTSGMMGLIDNTDAEFDVSFNHPSNFHGPTSLHIGDRRRYPLHSLKCGAEGYTDAAETSLHVRGHFVVEVSEIPTAFEYTLIPIDPGS